MITRTILAFAIFFLTVCPSYSQLSMQNPVSVDLVKRTVDPLPDCNYPCNRTAIIFIHGITSDSTAWQNKTTGTFWPKLLTEDSDLQTQIDQYFDVYQVTYFSERNQGPSVPHKQGVGAEAGRKTLRYR
jgi:hypothetical protein